MVVITASRFHQKPFSILAKRKKYRWHGQKAGGTRQKHTASVVAQAAEAKSDNNITGPNQ